MKSAQRFLVCSTIGLIAWLAPAAPAMAGQASASDPVPPSSIELALAQHSCGVQTSAPTDAHFSCLSAAVDALRATFGYDLTRLSAAERDAIDKVCGPLRTTEGRDGYIGCVSRELSALAIKKGGPVPATEPERVAPPTPAAASVESPSRRASWRLTAWLLGLLAVGFAAGAGIRVAMRTRVTQHRCRDCGALVSATADLCPDCRRQAAEAVRHAAAERAERERTNEESVRRPDPDDEQEQAPQTVEEPTPRNPGEQPYQRPAERDTEAADGRAGQEQTPGGENERRQQDNPADVAEVFDPYAILDVAPGATPDLIAAAYQRARSKYDPATVAFLGNDVRSYYRAKAEAVERAYRMLTGEPASSEPAARG